METFWQDVKYGVRMLVKTPGFTLVAVLTLALGIGANTAIFSVVHAVLLERLPYKNPDRLVFVWEHNLKRGRETNVVGPANFVRWREQAQSFEQLAAFSEWPANITGTGEPERVPIGYVTANFFEAIGAGAALGRTLVEEDGKRGNDEVVVLSDGYWRRRFGSDPQVVGKTFNLNGRPQTVVGVMPETFRGLMSVEMWSPMVVDERFRNARGRWMVVVGRLKPGVQVEQAQAEMTTVAARIAQELPDFTGGWGANVVPLREQLVKDLRPALLVLLGAVGFVLLIGCANLANLLLARAASREKEMAIRAALGAPRLRLLRQLLTESVLLAMLGGAAGVLLGAWSLEGLLQLVPAEIGRFTVVQLNREVLFFSAALSLATGLFFGLVPALIASRGAPNESLRQGGRTSAAGPSRPWLRDALVVSEVALSFVLLVGAGLLLRSFVRLQAVDGGFRTENVLSFQISLPGATYREPQRQVRFFGETVERLARLPGVMSAGAISWRPLGTGSATSFQVIGRPVPPHGEEPVAEVRVVTPHLFDTLGVPLLQGRGFGPEDSADAPKRVVINRTLAREHWPVEDPIGKHIRMSWGEDMDAEVIGVVGDVRLVALNTPPRATLYWALPQLPYEFMTVMVRSQQDPTALVPAIKTEIAGLDPELPLAKVQTLEQVKDESLLQPRFSMTLLGLFAGLALLLAAVGTYGVLSYSVAQRRHEIGIRMALGAQRSDVFRLVLGGSLALLGTGVALGLAGAFYLSRFLRTLLFEVAPHDLVTFASIPVVLVAVGLLACYLPARRATRVDPLVALRYE